MIVSPKDDFLLTLLVVFVLTAVSWIFFARFTMGRIEKRIVKDGFGDNLDWDGVGARVILYAYAIMLPEKYASRLGKRLLNSILIRKYATSSDWMGGLVFLILSNSLVLICLMGWLIWG